jgi:hypothetical protein
MPNITFTFGPTTKTYTITSPNAQRFVAWATAAYPTVPNPAFDAAKPVDPVTNPQTIPNPTPVLSVIDGLWAGLKANVQSSEKAAAMGTIAPPTDIT